jgi:flagellar basal-body rod protein FlgB
MNLLDSPYFGLLRERLDLLGQRQRMIAENIANASTPGYVPRDVDMGAFERMVSSQAGRVAGGGQSVRLAATHAGHMVPGGAGGHQASRVSVVSRADSETTMDGNAVVLEEQTMRAAQNRMDYEASLALYQKGLQLMRMAARAPGR